MKPIEASTATEAWLDACEHLLLQADWRDYTLVLEIADPLALPPPDRAVHDVLDGFLVRHGGLPVSTVVNTIFPAQLYVRHGAQGVYDRYVNEVYPQIRRHPDCSWGTYFHRIICRTGQDGDSINPLRDLIAKMRVQLRQDGPNRAIYEVGTIDLLLDIPIYEPGPDRNRPIGGPCLSHLSFKIGRGGELRLDAFYRSHFYVQRALGNLFGLAHLLNFVAEEVGIPVGALVCHSSMAQLDTKQGLWGKRDVRALIACCREARRPAAA